jgi:hypothetical protein
MVKSLECCICLHIPGFYFSLFCTTDIASRGFILLAIAGIQGI